MKNPLLLTLPLVLVTGCVAGPDYAGPPQAARALPGQFQRAGDEVDTAAPRASQWWTLLGDPVLDQLEARALGGNPGIAAARARIEQARARVRAEQANRFPTLGADATVAEGRLPDLNLQGPSSGAAGGGSGGGGDDRLSFYNLGAIANWELDFAGEQVRRSEAANAQAAAAVATGEDALVQLTAEVARAYVALREAQSRLALLESERDLQQQTLELTYARYTQGALALFPVGNAKPSSNCSRRGLPRRAPIVRCFAIRWRCWSERLPARSMICSFRAALSRCRRSGSRWAIRLR